MTEIKDKILYEKVKKEIYLKYPKHSAYRSGLLVKKYKEGGMVWVDQCVYRPRFVIRESTVY